MTPVELHEAGLLLRPWRPADADAVYRACQDPEIQRWTSVPVPYLPEHAEDFVTVRAPRAWAEGTGAPLGVFDAATGELLGSSGLVELAGPTAEIGYWTAPWARGRSVATRAARAVARWALGADAVGPGSAALGPLGIQRLVWRAEVGNHPSRRVALRVGFQEEGVQRLGAPGRAGTLADMWTGSLLAGEVRAEDGPPDPVADRQAATFSRPQPVLPATTARGESFTLRPLVDADVDDVTRACQDPESIRWTIIPQPYPRTAGESFVTGHAPRTWTLGGGVVYALADAQDQYLGSMELRIERDPAVGEVGFLVAPWARGRGYAPAALRALTRWGFDALALRRVEWRAYLGNEPSRRTVLKAGFTVEGIARAGLVQRGEVRDCWFGSLLATDVAAAG